MKHLLVILGLGLTIGIANVNTAKAQRVNIHVNIDIQPAWGPAGYDYAAFYFFPRLNIYYDVNNALFYYLHNRRWVSSYYLPVRYQRYDFYTLYKVVINDYHQPWIHNRIHRTNFAHYRNVRTQPPIRLMAADRRYNVARNNTRAWVEPRPVTNRQSSYNNNVNTRNNNASTRSVTPSTRDNRNQNNNQGVRNQNTPPTNNQGVNNQGVSSQSNQRPNVTRQSTTPNNQNPAVTTPRRSESRNTTTTRSTQSESRNNNTSSTRSSQNTQNSNRADRQPTRR